MIKTTITLFTSFLVLFSHAGAKSLEGTKPNIILVMTDDQGMGDLACMGNKVLKTPHIDRFYEGSTRFTDFQVSPTCTPTRAALMSGRSPFNVGISHTIFQRERMALGVLTLPQALKRGGYTTGIFGKWHLGDGNEYLPGNRGFDEAIIHGAGGIGQVGLGDFPPNKEHLYFDNTLLHNDTIVKTKGYCTDIFFDSALSWIKRKEDVGVPYFAFISLNAPHAPMVAPEKYTKRFVSLGYDDKTAGRYGMVENLDDNFGKLMKKLTEWNALENTIVIFMTDNGGTHLGGTLNGKRVKHFNANLRGGKNSPFEGGSHVPFFIQWEGKLEKGKDIAALVAHIDLYQTFTEVAGVALPKKMQELDGRSLLPLLEDPNAEWDDRQLFIHCGRWNPGERDSAKFEKCAVRTARWRFVNNKYLFDILNDPSEKKDVASAHPELVQKLRKDYDVWWDSTLPLLVNEGLPKVKKHPLHIKYEKQLETTGIPEWAPEAIK